MGVHTHLAGLSIENGSRQVDGAQGDTLEMVATFQPVDAVAFGLTVRCHADGSAGLPIRYAAGILDVAGTQVPLDLGSGDALELHLFLDKSVLELFVQGGVASVTRVNYPAENDLDVFVFAERGSVRLISLDVWELASVWSDA